MNREIRDFASALSIETRADDDPESRKIVGYAAVFNSPVDIGGFFREQISPGAFAESVKGGDVRALFDHDSAIVLGRNKAGTLELSEDQKGLRTVIDPPDTQAARDLIVSIERGDISGMSIGFTMRGGVEKWDESGDTPLRTIEKVGDLLDVSVVTYPAYPSTEAALRSFEGFQAQKIPALTPHVVRARLRLAEIEIAR